MIEPKSYIFDFTILRGNKGRKAPDLKICITACKSYVKLSKFAYQKLGGPEYIKAGIDLNNKAICVAPAVKSETGAIKITEHMLKKNVILIVKNTSVIKMLLEEVGIPKKVDGKLIDGELLFKF